MKRCIVSTRYCRIYFVGIAFLSCGLYGLWLIGEKDLSKVLFEVFVSAVGLVCLLIQFLGFSGGIFYIGEDGVGMRLYLVKKRVIPWNQIEASGVFRTKGNINIVYFSTKPLPHELMEGFLRKSRVREIGWLAFAEFDDHFVKKMIPAMPPKYAALLRERARQCGLKA